jgi:hypothetical protein
VHLGKGRSVVGLLEQGEGSHLREHQSVRQPSI